jgi:phosphatidylinositol glycan class A protein
MVSDFFHPSVGGVEGHIQMLALELISRGHTVRPPRWLLFRRYLLRADVSLSMLLRRPGQVVVITHAHPAHLGVRHLAGGLLKVYYLPVPVLTASATVPNFLLFLPYVRSLLVRESIDLVHGHASLSSLALEAVLHAPLLGVRTVWTDHSLFGFGDAVGVLTNKLLRGCLRNLDAGICVSHTGCILAIHSQSGERALR